MATYMVEVEYLLPVYKTVTVEAQTPHEAAQKALEDENWDGSKEDLEFGWPDYVTRIVEGTYDNIHIAPADALREVPAEFKLKTLAAEQIERA